jgi:hypothetical protein
VSLEQVDEIFPVHVRQTTPDRDEMKALQSRSHKRVIPVATYFAGEANI